MAQDTSAEKNATQERRHPATLEGQRAPDATKGGTRSDVSRRRRIYLAIVVVLIVVLALALGLGLGLGLKHSNKSNSDTSSGSPLPSSPEIPSEDSQASLSIPPWRSNVEDYTLDIANWDFNAPPTTREYNFTLSEIQLSPDGVFRTMIAINGRFPGPLIRANMGDRLIVNVQNNLPNGTAIHWHGLFQNGTNWMDGTSGITQCPIPPSGGRFTYNL
jgi:FtsP/CotA-like multicopper oxidase with cupredoxin domain